MSTTVWSSWLFQERPQLTFAEANEEFESLPENERFRLMKERYGQEEDIVENPAFISDSLQRFDAAMDSIPNKEAYETALFINPEYVESRKLRLAFLRADRFDAESAARRMARFWEAKVQLFGIDNAFNSHLSLFDFQDIDFPALACGAIRLMPQLDNAGRGIFCCDTEQYDPNPDSMIRMFWYLMEAAIFSKDDRRSESVQKHGMVAISAVFNQNNNPHVWTPSRLKAFATGFSHAVNALPVRFVGIHRFHDIGGFRKHILEHALYFMSQQLRKRIIIHSISDIKNTYELAAYGIPMEILPCQVGGSLDFNYQEWIHDLMFEDSHRLRAGLDVNNETWEEAVKECEEKVELLTTLMKFV